jgi:hypothetical protein
MRRIIVLSTLAASMAVMLALAGSASAAKPELETFHAEGTSHIVHCADDNGILRFTVLFDWEIDGRILTYFDSAGNPDYARAHVISHDFVYSTENPEEGFAEIESENFLIDFPSENVASIVATSGLRFRLTVPGEGVVLLSAGRLVFRPGEGVFVAGPQPVLEDYLRVCEVFAAS